jgi:hypothetical protein
MMLFSTTTVETFFESLVRICCIDRLIELLNNPRTQHNDMCIVSSCNRNLYNLVMSKMLKIDYIQYNNLTDGNVNRYEFYRNCMNRLIIDAKLINHYNKNNFSKLFLDFPKLTHLAFSDNRYQDTIDHIQIFPEGLTDLVLSNIFNQPLTKNIFPSSLINLQFGYENNRVDFDHPFPPGVLPQGLKTLKFSKYARYNQIFGQKSLPPNLEQLVLGNCYNKCFDKNILPETLTTLQLGYEYNQPFTEGLLPAGLTKLVFGEKFNQTLSNNLLQCNLKILHLGEAFNHIIDKNTLPRNLVELKFGHNFNPSGLQLFEPGIFPPTLKSLSFGFYFNQPIGQNVLPNGLIELRFKSLFNQPLDKDTLPHTIEKLYFGDHFDQPINNCLPLNLTELSFNGTYGGNFNQPLEKGIFPNGLLRLNLGDSFNQPLEKGIFPNGLINLHLGNTFNQPINGSILPESLQVLVFGNTFNQPINGISLPRLTMLKFGKKFNQPIDNISLPSLTRLEFGSKFNQPIIGYLGPKLRTLYVGDAFRRHPLTKKFHNKAFSSFAKEEKIYYENIKNDTDNHYRGDNFLNAYSNGDFKLVLKSSETLPESLEKIHFTHKNSFVLDVKTGKIKNYNNFKINNSIYDLNARIKSSY